MSGNVVSTLAGSEGHLGGNLRQLGLNLYMSKIIISAAGSPLNDGVLADIDQLRHAALALRRTLQASLAERLMPKCLQQG